MRIAFGDFNIIDPYQTWDYLDDNEEYKHDIKIVWASFIIWVVTSVFLYLMLMNFIIAVVCETYLTVKKQAVA